MSPDIRHPRMYLIQRPLHCLQVPSWAPCHGPPTRSPTFHFFSRGPTSTTSPISSWPGVMGHFTLMIMSNARQWAFDIQPTQRHTAHYQVLPTERGVSCIYGMNRFSFSLLDTDRLDKVSPGDKSHDRKHITR